MQPAVRLADMNERQRGVILAEVDQALGDEEAEQFNEDLGCQGVIFHWVDEDGEAYEVICPRSSLHCV